MYWWLANYIFAIFHQMLVYLLQLPLSAKLVLINKAILIVKNVIYLIISKYVKKTKFQHIILEFLARLVNCDTNFNIKSL